MMYGVKSGNQLFEFKGETGDTNALPQFYQQTNLFILIQSDISGICCETQLFRFTDKYIRLDRLYCDEGNFTVPRCIDLSSRYIFSECAMHSFKGTMCQPQNCLAACIFAQGYIG